MTIQKLYRVITLLYIGGLAWVIFSLNFHAPSVCIIKTITGVPCPSCGATRSVMSIFHGHFTEAFFWNPLGFLLATILVLVPIVLLYDKYYHKQSLLIIYQKTEQTLRNKKVYIPLILMIIINWAWNIYKHV